MTRYRHNLDELKARIASEMDVDQILDILGWTTYELVDALEDEIETFREGFEKAVE